jgi:putative two-component system response regulator
MDDVAPRTGRIVVVDDLDINLTFMRRLLTRCGHEVITTSDSRAALDLIAREQPDVVMLDVVMPGLDGIQLCALLKQHPSTRLTPVILITSLPDHGSKVAGIDAGADDFLTRPVSAPELEARIRSLVRLKRYTDDLDSADAVIMSLALTVEARDPNTIGHCQRLAAYATALGKAIGLDPEDLAALHRGGFLHDVGKIGIPDAILFKPGGLTNAEFASMQRHTVIGYELCGELRSLARVRQIVRHHHERLDGSGYPDGLRGDAIPYLAQIMSIVDVFDAITTARPYKNAQSVEHGFDELAREVANGWKDPALVDLFCALVRSKTIQVPRS